MAKVRCPCGREYIFPDQHLGKRVKCAKCEQTFVAKASAAAAPPTPQAPSKKRIGDLAVAAGFLTRDQLAACVQYQQALRKIPGGNEPRLGDILVEKKLISKAQLERLLGTQRGASPEAAAAAAVTPKAPIQGKPVTEEQREGIRATIEKAARQQRDQRRDIRAARDKGPSRLARLRPLHVGLALAVVAVLILLIRLWPAPAPTQALVAYLTSCDEANTQPDASLATRDLGLSIREFREVTLLPATSYDYQPELEAFCKPEATQTWQELLASAKMPPEKEKALKLLLPAIPPNVTPNSVGGLTITVQPATSFLQYKRRGTGWLDTGRFRFVLLRATSPAWESGWKVADYERDEQRKPG